MKVYLWVNSIQIVIVFCIQRDPAFALEPFNFSVFEHMYMCFYAVRYTSGVD